MNQIMQRTVRASIALALTLAGITIATTPVHAADTTLAFNRTSISNTPNATISVASNAPGDTNTGVFLNGVFHDLQTWSATPTELNWQSWSSEHDLCATDLVVTYRLYDGPATPTWDTPYLATASATWVADSHFCDVTYDVSADTDEVLVDGDVTFTTDAPDENLAAVFADGILTELGAVSDFAEAVNWSSIGGCNPVTVTYRVYDALAEGAAEPTFASTFAGSVDVSVDADPSACSSEDRRQNIALDIQNGENIADAKVNVEFTGLKPGADYSVVVRSTPQTIEQGVIAPDGVLLSNVAIPGGLEAGWHSITIESTNFDGSAAQRVLWFQINSNGVLLATSFDAPSALARTGVDPLGAGVAALLVLLAGVSGVALLRRKANAVA